MQLLKWTATIILLGLIAYAPKVDTQELTNSGNAVEFIPPETSRDAILERAIVRANPYYNRESVEIFGSTARYFYNKIDLNGDNNPEILVHIVGSTFCGSGGCTTLIFQTVGQDYQLVSEISLSTAPIIVMEQKSFGWNNLAMLAAGGSWGDNQGYWLLSFNGIQYPENPGDGIKLDKAPSLTGKVFFDNLDYDNGGIHLLP